MLWILALVVTLGCGAPPTVTAFYACVESYEIACDCGDPNLADGDDEGTDACDMTNEERIEACRWANPTVCDPGHPEYGYHLCNVLDPSPRQYWACRTRTLRSTCSLTAVAKRCGAEPG